MHGFLKFHCLLLIIGGFFLSVILDIIYMTVLIFVLISWLSFPISTAWRCVLLVICLFHCYVSYYLSSRYVSMGGLGDITVNRCQVLPQFLWPNVLPIYSLIIRFPFNWPYGNAMSYVPWISEMDPDPGSGGSSFPGQLPVPSGWFAFPCQTSRPWTRHHEASPTMS